MDGTGVKSFIDVVLPAGNDVLSNIFRRDTTMFAIAKKLVAIRPYAFMRYELRGL